MHNSRVGCFIRGILLVSGCIVFAGTLAAIVIFANFVPGTVRGLSMEPTRHDGEMAINDRFVYRLIPIRRNDIITFYPPRIVPEVSKLEKRAVGLPGETVVIRQGIVFVDGREIPEPYVASEFRDKESMVPVKIPPRHYFVLGDNRAYSGDSRWFGPISERTIFGKTRQPSQHFCHAYKTIRERFCDLPFVPFSLCNDY